MTTRRSSSAREYLHHRRGETEEEEGPQDVKHRRPRTIPGARPPMPQVPGPRRQGAQPLCPPQVPAPQPPGTRTPTTGCPHPLPGATPGARPSTPGARSSTARRPRVPGLYPGCPDPSESACVHFVFWTLVPLFFPNFVSSLYNPFP